MAKFANFVFAVIFALGGFYALASEVASPLECRGRMCWLNGLLYAVFDKAGTRYAVAGIFFFLALVSALSLFTPSQKK